jgi:hypothetical protein
MKRVCSKPLGIRRSQRASQKGCPPGSHLGAAHLFFAAGGEPNKILNSRNQKKNAEAAAAVSRAAAFVSRFRATSRAARLTHDANELAILGQERCATSARSSMTAVPGLGSSIGRQFHPLLHYRRISKDDTHNVCRCRARRLGQQLPPVEASELRETGRPKHGMERCFQLLPVGRLAHFAGKLAPIRVAGHGVQWPQSPQQTSSAKLLAAALPRNLIRRPRRPSIGSDVPAWNAESNSWLNGAPGRNSISAPIRALRLQCRAKDIPARCTPRAA